MTDETFSTLHIALTAAVSGILVLAAAYWLQRHDGTIIDWAAPALLSGAAVFLWRQSANMPQLNSDGLSGFSANDWLAPVVTYVVLGCYEAFRNPPRPSFAQTRAVAAIIALVVNVVTI